MASFDTLIREAEVYDGCAGAPFHADVGVRDGRIEAIGDLGGRAARVEISAAGLALAPGFIDCHTHDDFAALRHPEMSFKSRGGVTTCIVGNCGFGAAPYDAAVSLLDALTPGSDIAPYTGHAGYAARLDAVRPGVNIGVLAGHGTLRLAAMGRDARPPSAGELKHMKQLLSEALDAGVLGLSSGLIYAPSRYADTEELVALAREMRGSGALYATHLRDEAAGLLVAVGEAISIGERAGVAVQISHHKAAGRENWGAVSDSLRLIEAAQARGLEVHADQYPYTAGSTLLAAILDNGAFTSGAAGGIGTPGAAEVVIACAPGRAEWEGKSIAALALALGLPERAAAEAIAAQAPATTAIVHMMSEDDVQTVLRHPSTMIGSDGIPTLDGRPHPRLYNSFARVLGYYARELRVLDLPTAIQRMTGFAAGKFGLRDRGVIAEGAHADLVLFAPDTIIDRGTYAEPNRYPDGIIHVFVNGEMVVRDGSATAARPGQVLRRLP